MPVKRNRPQPLLTAGENVKQVPYHPDLTTGYAGITPISANLRVVVLRLI
ncbi:hypothetical protein AA98_0002 [Escherichia coli 2-011-08_S1_C1]|nr:hypothetical protein AA98_0002 [Escherichia coli 2-011-08_S1_C1]